MATAKHPVNYLPVSQRFPYRVLAKDTIREWLWLHENCPGAMCLLVPASRSGSNARYGFIYEADAVAFKLKFGTNP